MNAKKNKKEKKDKSLEIISNKNRKAVLFIVSSTIIVIGIIIFLFYYFFYSELEKARKEDIELYFAILFINDNNIPYGAYAGAVSSLHNRAGIVGFSRNTALWLNKNEENIPLYKLYENGGSKEVFKAIEISIGKKISYKITVDNNQISDIIDLIGGVKMYVEEPIEYSYKERNGENNYNNYNLSFGIGEWFFHGNKIVAYLNYLTMKGYEDIETLYKLEDVIINVIIGFIRNPEIRNIMMSNSIRKAIVSKMKSNLRPPDIKVLFDILANCNERTLIVESIDASIDDRGFLNPILEGSALIRQMDDLALYVGLKTQKSDLENEDISLIVLNGTKVGGLADRISIRMRYRGFNAGEYGNFSINNLNESAVIIRNGQIERAFIVARECRINRVYAKTDRRLLNNVVLILGNDYYEIAR